MEFLSERYGWTPTQIRDMNLEDVCQYLEIVDEMKALEKARAMSKA